MTDQELGDTKKEIDNIIAGADTQRKNVIKNYKNDILEIKINNVRDSILNK